VTSAVMLQIDWVRYCKQLLKTTMNWHSTAGL